MRTSSSRHRAASCDDDEPQRQRSRRSPDMERSDSSVAARREGSGTRGRSASSTVVSGMDARDAMAESVACGGLGAIDAGTGAPSDASNSCMAASVCVGSCRRAAHFAIASSVAARLAVGAGVVVAVEPRRRVPSASPPAEDSSLGSAVSLRPPRPALAFLRLLAASRARTRAAAAPVVKISRSTGADASASWPPGGMAMPSIAPLTVVPSCQKGGQGVRVEGQGGGGGGVKGRWGGLAWRGD
mmetsp:Transcript_1525/g.4838  ORF Transcript_1525/g.4838 Transcript_1525/m.4838 type:complete len:243 (+) Transcript_1525:1123-1851(+)